MESWQELLRKQSLASLDVLAARFGAEHLPDLERLRQALAVDQLGRGRIDEVRLARQRVERALVSGRLAADTCRQSRG